jgi:hypothetical protein
MILMVLASWGWNRLRTENELDAWMDGRMSSFPPVQTDYIQSYLYQFDFYYNPALETTWQKKQKQQHYKLLFDRAAFIREPIG